MKKFRYSYTVYILCSGYDKNGNYIRRWRLLLKRKAHTKAVILNRLRAYTDIYSHHYKFTIRREV